MAPISTSIFFVWGVHELKVSLELGPLFWNDDKLLNIIYEFIPGACVVSS